MADTEANLRASIGNYKGVMLCTRPNEDAGQKKERPFISRVEIHDTLGVNPVKKKLQQPERKATNIVLKRHKEWLQKFQTDIQSKKEEEEIKKLQEEERRRIIRDNAAVDRVKMKTLKEEFNKANDSIAMYGGETRDKSPSPVVKPAKLTAKNLQKFDEETSQQGREEAAPEPPRETEKAAKKSKKGKEKPKWAMTEQELEGVENAEVDDLLDFASNLDYDQFMYDMEVRNMVTAIQTRINDLKQEDNWKEKVVDEWNKNKEKDAEQKEKRTKGVTFDDDNRSQHSNQSKKSVQSIRSQIKEEKKLDEKASDWDASSTKGRQIGVEERIAKLVADEILKNNPNLRSVHSNNSIRKILEREAQKMVNDDTMKSPNPLIAVTKDYTLGRSDINPSNLPYLHRNPAV